MSSSENKMKIHAYTRPVDTANYPAGLAHSVHLAVEMADGTLKPYNKNYGILFPEGRISEENTIVPLGIRHPALYQREDGVIGICGELIHEDGSLDETASGKVYLWETKDLIHFHTVGLVDIPAVLQFHPNPVLEVGAELAKKALIYWSPISCTGLYVPQEVHVKSAEGLETVQATLLYSDGSTRQKQVHWKQGQVDFTQPGIYPVEGTVRQQYFDFPLTQGYGDPVLFPWEGKWYFISTYDNLNDIGLYVREADTAEGLFEEGIEEHLILPYAPERGFEQTFWAPEFHVIGGELYILFAVSGSKWGPQCHLMKKKKTGRIIDEDGWEEPIRVVRQDGQPLTEDAITLDMTYVEIETGSYMIWSYRENIGTPLDSGSMLHIASIDPKEPWKLTSDPVLLTRPLLGWENVAGTINNEGPHAFIKDGTLYVTYSGGHAAWYTYALGLLTASTKSDLLDLNAWTKSITPVLTFYSVDGEFGPGHNSFFTNEDGELMIAYHGETSIESHKRCDGIRRVHFRADGTPYFGMAKWEDVGKADVTTMVIVD